jgi:HK97 family phage portal protein
MAWYNFKKEVETEEKLNPAQPYYTEKTAPSKEPTYTYQGFYDTLEVVSRGVNMIVDDAADIPSVVGASTAAGTVRKGLRKTTVQNLISVAPNPYQDINSFRRALITDMVLDGNIFIYFDGASLYHLPASNVTIVASEREYVEKYTYNNIISYSPSEIIHVKDNSFNSIYRGVPRLKSALRTMKLIATMQNFQDNFFKNGAVPGLVIKSPNTLSSKIKERLVQSWMQTYTPNTGGRRPMMLDGGLEIDSISKVNFKELDFEASIEKNELRVLKALGVPPIMLDSGNNANLRPNMRMYYLETVLPIVRKINYSMERFFGFQINEDITNIPALQPELSDLANYYSSLTNNGIIKVNEAREALGFEADLAPESDILRIPQNIAGSAGNPSEGGRPPEDTE